MGMGMAKLFSASLVMAVLLITLAGCQKKAAFSTCKNDADCRIDANGSEINGVCHMGKCEECVQDSDCSDLKSCVRNRCLAPCEADADCGDNKHCEDSYCMNDCVNNESCLADQICSQGRCIAKAGGADPNAWASGDCQGLERIHFDFDRFDIKDEDKNHVSRLAKCLEANPGYKAVIKGNTDNRGTPSYNMALGQKRADAVKTHLINNWGIASNRLTTISNGEQEPVITENNEYAWQQNRNAQFILQAN